MSAASPTAPERERTGSRAVPWLSLAGLAFSYRSLVSDASSLVTQQGVERAVFGARQEIAGLVVLAAAWLAWRRWPSGASQPSQMRGRVASAAAAALGVAVFGWAQYTGSDLLRVLSLLPLVSSFALRVHGSAGLRRLAFPLVVLSIALPLPPRVFQLAVWQLQLGAAQAGSALLNLAGVYHTLSGIQIQRGEVNFLVAEPCSGLQSLATLALIAVIVRELLGGAARARSWLILLVAPALAFGLNALRVAWIACLDQAQGEAASHTSQGLAVLIAGSVLLYAVGLVVCGSAAAEDPRTRDAAEPGAPIRWTGTAAVVALLVGLSWLPRADTPRRAQPPLDGIAFQSLAGWVGTPLPIDRQFLGTLAIGSMLSRHYTRPTEEVDLCVGADAGLPSRSPFSPKTLLPGAGFRVEEQGRESVARLRRGVDVAVLRDAREQRLVYHWRFGDRGFAADLLGALTGLDASPFARTQPRGFARLSTPIEANAPEARERARRTLDRYLLAFGPALAALDGS